MWLNLQVKPAARLKPGGLESQDSCYRPTITPTRSPGHLSHFNRSLERSPEWLQATKEVLCTGNKGPQGGFGVGQWEGRSAGFSPLWAAGKGS